MLEKVHDAIMVAKGASFDISINRTILAKFKQITLVLVNLDLSFFENIVDIDQLAFGNAMICHLIRIHSE